MINSNNDEQQTNDSNFMSKPYIRAYERAPIHRIAPKMGRNEICKIKNVKFKKCCGAKNLDFCQNLLANYFKCELEKNDD